MNHTDQARVTRLRKERKQRPETRAIAFDSRAIAIHRDRAKSRSGGLLDYRVRSMARRMRTSPRRAPRQKRAEDTVLVLLEATEIVLAKHGFVGTTTNHIAEAAGVSIGTLYHYYPSKEALIEAVVHRMWMRE